MDRPIDPLPLPAGYFKLVLEIFGRTRESREALLEGTGFATPEDVPDEITVAQALRQLRNGTARLPAGWGLELGARFQTATHGYVGFGAVSAPTLRDAMAIVERYTTVRHPALELHGEAEPRVFALVLRTVFDLVDSERLPLFESYFLSIEAIVEAILGRRVEGARLELVGRPFHAERYASFFHSQVVFDADRNALVLPEEWLDLPSPLAHAAMHDSARRALQELSERLLGDRSTAARVVRLMASGGDAGRSMDSVARALGVSPRTLIRRLTDAGINYRELRDDHRRRRAEDLLARSDLAIAQIAERLGYEGASNFGRACRRWFACSPRIARRKLRAKEL